MLNFLVQVSSWFQHLYASKCLKASYRLIWYSCLYLLQKQKEFKMRNWIGEIVTKSVTEKMEKYKNEIIEREIKDGKRSRNESTYFMWWDCAGGGSVQFRKDRQQTKPFSNSHPVCTLQCNYILRFNILQCVTSFPYFRLYLCIYACNLNNLLPIFLLLSKKPF